MNNKKKNFGITIVVIVVIVGAITGIIYLGKKSFEKSINIENFKSDKNESEILKVKKEITNSVKSLNEKLDKISRGDVQLPEKKIKEIVKNQSKKNIETPKIIDKPKIKNIKISETYSDGTTKKEQNFTDGLKNGKDLMRQEKIQTYIDIVILES